jgi:acetylornithine deacetylase/succinyl-diaminopimelate desuccinylase-like protein
MKTEGILQLLALIRLRRENVPLDRDVIFLATADEEVDFQGALRALSPEGWHDRLARAEYLITEGARTCWTRPAAPSTSGWPRRRRRPSG